MKTMWRHFKAGLVNLHRDEQGAEGFEKILIIGAIVLPLLGALFFFKESLTDWLSGLWGDVKSDNQDYTDNGDKF